MRNFLYEFGNRFLLGSKFTNGEIWPKNVSNELIDTLYKWWEYKDADWGMKRYRTEKTQSVCFLEVIDIQTLKTLINNLAVDYKESYPFSKTEDFINDVFGYTVYRLEFLINNNFSWYGASHLSNKYDFHYIWQDYEFIDIAIPAEYDERYIKQYYNIVLKVINDVSLTELDESGLNEMTKQDKSPTYEADYHNKLFTSKEGEDLFNYLTERIECNNANLSYIFWKLNGTSDTERFYIIRHNKNYVNYCQEKLGIEMTRVKTMETIGKKDEKYNWFNTYYNQFFREK